jgi:HK97 family phage portal protein
MGFLARISSWLRKGQDWGTLERYLAWAFGGGASATGIIVNPQNAMQAAAVYSCIKVLSESVGMLPLNVWSKTVNRRELASSLALFDVLHSAPNEYQSTVELLEMWVTHLCLRGNAFAFINRTRSGVPVELLPLHPDMVAVTMADDFTLQYNVSGASGTARPIPRENILHIRGQTLNGWLGISPIAYAREAIGLSLATERFGAQLFRNGAKVGGVLEHPGTMTKEAYLRLKDSFDEAHNGENAHKTALLEEGVKYNKISMTPDDSQFLETRKFQRSEIASIFRVPPHMIADLERATFSNIEQMALEFVQFSLMPWLNRIEAALERDLLTPEQRRTYCIEFDARQLMRGDTAARATYYGRGILDGWLTRNEARAMEDLNPIDGLDEPLVPLNMIGGDSIPPTKPPPKPPADGANPTNQPKKAIEATP